MPCRSGAYRVEQLQLTDLDIDRQLLDLPGRSLLLFTGQGCASCRWAYEQLPHMSLPLERLCWIDAERNGGAVARYEVFHLPALFVVCDGQFYGAIRSSLNRVMLTQALEKAFAQQPDELP
ncbi:thioredoxin [Pseudomonas sp. 21LCFQ02]|uniref:thioredoxin n=1 Tax=unclassified Pseudomonas TaxID=196821 RepID=UPI001185A4F5|nr:MULTISPECIES: thioredoxin [unclassified Pseudomonas]MCO8165544.1 thioredoxin [Pseudomonas sp. 21LCFQ010]MCO8170436.1 thioredoxin [Pseudomonas sp. 21LCFQ02]MCQ9425538.1 thioredoxin [Pseudomonas sp. LJDD11]